MRYFYERPNQFAPLFGVPYECNHPLYKQCTLYLQGNLGLAVIQQRFDPIEKVFWWGVLDPWLANDIYLHPRFDEYFSRKAEGCRDGLYPTVEVRKLMWALRMKPLPKQWWES